MRENLKYVGFGMAIIIVTALATFFLLQCQSVESRISQIKLNTDKILPATRDAALCSIVNTATNKNGTEQAGKELVCAKPWDESTLANKEARLIERRRVCREEGQAENADSASRERFLQCWERLNPIK